MGGNNDLQFTISGSESIQKINLAAQAISKLLQQSPMIANARNAINQPMKQLSFNINTINASQAGINSNEINKLLSIYYGGKTLDNYFNIDGLSVSR